MSTQEQKIINVYAEATPNPESLKFVVNTMLVKGTSFDFENIEKAEKSPLAKALFELGSVQSVFIANNFITINKTPDKMWIELIPLFRKFIKEYIESGKRIFAEDISIEDATYKMSENDGEIEMKIKELLNEHIKPAVEMDGGAIDFNDYNDGVVSLTLRGACSGCPSATVTLKSGIEGLLKRMIPEVKEVVAHQG